MSPVSFRNFLILMAIIVSAGLTAGCSTFGHQNYGNQSADGKEGGGPPPPLYYDFGDILIPSELELDRKASFVFQTSSLTAGVLALNGHLDVTSLVKFFEINMSKDNWEPVSSFKSIRTIMLFRKENRWCVINISENTLSTDVEVWVAPTSNEPDTGLLK